MTNEPTGGTGFVSIQPLTRPNVYARVHAALSDLPAIGKDSRAPENMGGYNFRGIESMTAALKPRLAEHGVFMVPSILERRESGRTVGTNRTMHVVDLHVRFEFFGIDGDSFVATMWGQGTDMGDKATQKAVTSAFKSMLAVTFCISDSETDAEAHSVPDTTARPARAETIHGVVALVEWANAVVPDVDVAQWVRDQEFPWPWTAEVCAEISAAVGRAVTDGWASTAGEETTDGAKDASSPADTDSETLPLDA